MSSWLRRHLNLGPATLTPPVVAGPTDPADFRHSGAGLLGAGILSQFVVTIDYRSGRAYFAPVAGRKLGSVLHGTGMAFYKPDHEGFDVLDVLAGSGAERAGLRPGDRIVEVAGQPARIYLSATSTISVRFRRILFSRF